MEVKNKYAYVITQDICNKFIEVIFLWDVWFGGQIVCYNIEHPSIINKIAISFLHGVVSDVSSIMKTHTVLASPTASQAKKGPTSSSGTSGTAAGGLPPLLPPSSGGTGSSSAGHNFARSIQSSLRSVSLGRNVDPPHSGTGSRGRTLLQRLAGLRRSFNSREKVHQEVPSQR